MRAAARQTRAPLLHSIAQHPSRLDLAGLEHRRRSQKRIRQAEKGGRYRVSLRTAVASCDAGNTSFGTTIENSQPSTSSSIHPFSIKISRYHPKEAVLGLTRLLQDRNDVPKLGGKRIYRCEKTSRNKSPSSTHLIEALERREFF